MRSAVLFSTAMAANPIRRVVTLLQDMKSEIEADGEKEAALYKKYECYCKNTSTNLGDDQAKAQSELETNNAQAEEKTALKKATEAELKQHKQDRADAQEALATATETRKQEKAEYEANAGEHLGWISGVEKAIAVLAKGGSGTAFLQSSQASVIKNLVSAGMVVKLDGNDRDTLMAFLEKDYVPQGGEIVGILKNMLDEFKKDLGSLQTNEEAAIAAFKQLKAAKESEIAAATAAIETKLALKGTLAVEITEHKAAAEAAAKELGDAAEFLANLKTMCSDKAADWEARSKERADEIDAINMAITTLNDDDALDIFKKSLPSPAAPTLVQRHSKSSPVGRVEAILKSKLFKKSPALSLLAHTTLQKLKAGVDFSKIIAMIDDMIALLGQEQKDDRSTFDSCNTNLRNTKQDHKDTVETLDALAAEIARLESSIAAHKATVEQKTNEIAALDKAMVEATENRAADKKAFDEFIALNTSAIQLIKKAINQLNKFYNPHMFKAAEDRQLTEEEHILRGAGQDIGDTTAKVSIAGTTQSSTLVFTQIASNDAGMPPPPPETYGEHKSKSGKSNSVIKLMDKLVNDLQTEINTGEHDEKVSIRDYEKLMEDSKADRAGAVDAVANEETAIASDEEALGAATDDQTSNTTRKEELEAQIAQLHADCDFLIANFDERKAARTDEIDGLTKAKAVLSGASFE